ncbi:mannose-6-phosphate isomerase, class I [Listeria booriae]|uniref:Mannose-6-phosphate isomerase n=1 Tax=Listeria booriae TaxID=1552123 RepID=A0A7X0TN30_9LIST|nr:mannose-6-phosphate isomerase, class I [Listeria booriae]MBC1332153.1 mannose-6-phosphate isomerase, class I [Listeria booriae]MBC2387075.1 mannose-6-phosphate isomerase, class I [Listeria booriae]
MTKALFLDSVFQDRIWGGTKLRDFFGYTIPSETTGEYWAISAHPHGPSTVKNDAYKGKTLIELWEQEPALFGNPKEAVFPLLTKILDANTDLSVQVHPDDAYAKEHENGELGKTECWYIIDCEPGAELVYGHNATSKEQLIEWTRDGKWSELLRKVAIKPGDFFYVPSGTIHALCTGTLVLETQQSSDTTYRVYDYDRVDDHGNKRELHLGKAIDVTTVPHHDAVLDIKTETTGALTKTTFVDSDFFAVYKWDIDGKADFTATAPYTLVSVLDGEAMLTIDGDATPIKKADHFLLPNTCKNWTIDGKVSCIVSTPAK